MKATRLLLLAVLLAGASGAGLSAHAAPRAPAQLSATPTPSVSSTNPETETNRKVVGLVYLTVFAAGGFLLARFIRRGKPPRPPGPFGSIRKR